MNFSACFIIPNYNHHQMFESVLDELLSFDIPIVVVNDASNNVTSCLLQELEKKYFLVSLIERKENGGKGAAVKDGMQFAIEKGYTHALQVDADGQHNLADIKSFLIAAQDTPGAVICGYPVYDQSVPMGRLLPRYITHFWVWVETLSFQIKDSMCGFRVYPLDKLEDLLNTKSLGDRMDFDIEVLVRLYWQNNSLVFLPTKVIYPEDGVSHFNLLNDNWLITKMHTRLFFGMLKRLRRLISMQSKKKKQLEQTSEGIQHWGHLKEKGSLLGLKVLVACYKIFGRKIFTLLLHPVIAYFALTSKSAREESSRFLRHVYRDIEDKENIGWRKNYAHFYEFGVSAIDKIACWMDDIKRKDVVIHNKDLFETVFASKRGAVFIGSHLGNLELCRALGEKGKRVKLNAIVYNKHALKFQKVMSQSHSEVELNLIHVEEFGADTAILLEEKIEQGEIIIIVGDRVSLNAVGRHQKVDFLGEKAPFAQGPFILAGILNCPVYLIFCLKEKGVYNIYLEHFYNTLKFPRRERHEQLSKAVQLYADRLAFYCKKAPLQWFNFFDFWQQDSTNNGK